MKLSCESVSNGIFIVAFTRRMFSLNKNSTSRNSFIAMVKSTFISMDWIKGNLTEQKNI